MGKFEIPEPPKTDTFENPPEQPKSRIYASKELIDSMHAKEPNPDPDLAPLLPTFSLKGNDAMEYLSRHAKSAKELLKEAQADAEKMANAQRARMNALGHAEHNPIHTDRHH